MRHPPHDDGGAPHRHGSTISRAQDYVNTASQLAGVVSGIYQAGKAIIPYIRPAATAVMAALA